MDVVLRNLHFLSPVELTNKNICFLEQTFSIKRLLFTFLDWLVVCFQFTVLVLNSTFPGYEFYDPLREKSRRVSGTHVVAVNKSRSRSGKLYVPELPLLSGCSIPNQKGSGLYGECRNRDDPLPANEHPSRVQNMSFSFSGVGEFRGRLWVDTYETLFN